MPCYFRILTKRTQGSNLCGLHRLKLFGCLEVWSPQPNMLMMQLENNGRNVFSSVCC